MNMNLSKLQKIVKDREAWSAAVHGIVKSLTWLSNSTTTLPCQKRWLQMPHVLKVSYPPISSSAIPFFSCLQSFPVSGSLPMNWLFASGVQSIGASALVLPMNIQDWFPLALTGWISLQSKGHSRVFSNTTVQKHQFFGTQPSLWTSSHIHPWLLEKS